MRRIQGKNHKTGIYEINKILLSVFDDKIFVLFLRLKPFHKKLKKNWLEIILIASFYYTTIIFMNQF